MESECKSWSDFLTSLDALVERTTEPQTCVAFVRQHLTALLQASVFLAPEYTTPAPASYARHLVYRHPQDRYAVVAMVWLSGQGTPIHDHGGVWCVEGVYQGHMCVTQYDVTPVDEQRVHAVPVQRIDTGLGDVGALIPPYDYHVMANTSQDPAVTIHVYGAELKRCHVFVPDGDNTYCVQTRELHYTDA